MLSGLGQQAANDSSASSSWSTLCLLRYVLEGKKNPLLWHIFLILPFCPVCSSYFFCSFVHSQSVASSAVLKLPVYRAWNSLFLCKEDSCFASALHSSGDLFFPCWCKEVLQLPHSCIQQGLPWRAFLEPYQSFGNYCKVVLQGGEIPARHSKEYFRKGRYQMGTQLKVQSPWVVQIAMQLPWMIFFDLLFFFETMTKGNRACILPIPDKHCWLYLPQLFSWRSW